MDSLSVEIWRGGWTSFFYYFVSFWWFVRGRWWTRRNCRSRFDYYRWFFTIGWFRTVRTAWTFAERIGLSEKIKMPFDFFGIMSCSSVSSLPSSETNEYFNEALVDGFLGRLKLPVGIFSRRFRSTLKETFEGLQEDTEEENFTWTGFCFSGSSKSSE